MIVNADISRSILQARITFRRSIYLLLFLIYLFLLFFFVVFYAYLCFFFSFSYFRYTKTTNQMNSFLMKIQFVTLIYTRKALSRTARTGSCVSTMSMSWIILWTSRTTSGSTPWWARTSASIHRRRTSTITWRSISTTSPS